MRTTYHQAIGMKRPKRGDIMQSNIGDKRERTWLVIAVRVLRTQWCKEYGYTAQRTKVWAERWWEMEPELRLSLYRSAERNGGQNIHPFYRFKTKHKPTFEDLMRSV